MGLSMGYSMKTCIFAVAVGAISLIAEIIFTGYDICKQEEEKGGKLWWKYNLRAGLLKRMTGQKQSKPDRDREWFSVVGVYPCRRILFYRHRVESGARQVSLSDRGLEHQPDKNETCSQPEL